jgi:hypothetical protein
MDEIVEPVKTHRPKASLAEMTAIAREYCELIENLESGTSSEAWIKHMGKLLPKLHTTVILLESPQPTSFSQYLENDDVRCELFMRLNEFFLSNQEIWPDFDKYDLKIHMCESLAYDFTDMYFDLKRGLELLEIYPNQPNHAASDWRSSFFYHWGRQLVDAEGWLHAVGYCESTAGLSDINNIRTA